MKIFITVLVMSLMGLGGKAQTDSRITLGTIDSIDSKILHEKRKIWVYVPGDGQPGIYAKSKYPVVYLLDGDGHFFSVVGMIQQLSSVNGNTILPEMIVVGIPNTDRTRDLTPTHVDVDPMMNDSSSVRTSGGGEQFNAFLEKELLPYIDTHYPTLPYRTFIGHSLGGLTVMNTLINHKHLFNAYIAIDPSMWWDNENLLNQARKAFSQQSFKRKSLFLGIANTMRRGMDTAMVLRDTSMITQHIRSILALNSILKTNKSHGLDYDFKYYRNDTHGSVPLISTYDALRHVFRFYDFQLDMEEYMNLSMHSVTKIENHFKNISERFGFNFPIPEAMVNQLGYISLSQKKMEEAGYLFKLNVKNFPTSLNAYDSLGDFYAANGEKDKAIDAYRKALKIKEWPDTRNKLNDLLKK